MPLSFCCYTTSPHMSPTYCEVALPVPLRSLFTYEIPERLAGSVCAGSRVLVPFRNRAMTGVVVEASVRRPDPARVKNVREIVEVLDRDSGAAAEAFGTGALGGRLLRGAAGGSVSRDAAAADRSAARARISDDRCGARAPRGTGRGRESQRIRSRGAGAAFAHGNRGPAGARGPLAQAARRRSGGGAAAAAQAARSARSRGAARRRACRKSSRGMRRVPNIRPQAEACATLPEKEARVFHVLAEERGPLPLPQLAKLAKVSRPLDRTDDPPGKTEMLGRAARHRRRFVRCRLHAAFQYFECGSGTGTGSNSRLARCGRFYRGASLRRHRQREDGSVSGRRRSGARAEQDRADSGSGNRADALVRKIVPGAVRRGRRGAAQRAAGSGARARVVARAARRGARRGGNALGRFRAGRKSGPDRGR